MEIVAEVWRDVQSNLNYEVSSRGRVRSKQRVVMRSHGIPRRVRERIMKPAATPRGYWFVSLYEGGKSKQAYLHRLVAEAFIGPCPAGIQVNHKDLNKANNVVGNLEYVTPQENMAHAHEAGRLGGTPKYTEQQIRQGYELVKSGMLYREAAAICGVNQDALEAACRGDNWGVLGLLPIRRAPTNAA